MLRFDHVAIACRDVEVMRAWYEKTLGFQVAARKSPARPDAPGTTYLSGPAGSSVTIELMPDDRTPPVRRQPFHPGLSHIALAVDDFAAWEARLSAAGVRWLGARGEAVGGGALRSFLDPEDNMLQIVARPS